MLTHSKLKFPTKISRNSCDWSNIIITFRQSYRSFILTRCLSKIANINSRNYYDLLGIDRTANEKEIRKAFLKLSKRYHPDSNAADKTLHEKFVRINEAFTILSKQSTRTLYDQSLNSVSYSSPYRSNVNAQNRNTAHWDKEFYEVYRQKMEHDRKYSHNYSHHSSQLHTISKSYFASISILLIVIGCGMFIYALQWRYRRFSEQQFLNNPRSRHYYAYREWQRLNSRQHIDDLSIEKDSSNQKS